MQILQSSLQVVLLKNEFGDVEVDSELAKESSVQAVSEILSESSTPTHLQRCHHTELSLQMDACVACKPKKRAMFHVTNQSI